MECETAFAEDLLGQGVSGSVGGGHAYLYLEHVADRRLRTLGMEPMYGSRNPFAFLELQDVQELANFFERRVSAYQVGVGEPSRLDEDFLSRPTLNRRTPDWAPGSGFAGCGAGQGDGVDPAAPWSA